MGLFHLEETDKSLGTEYNIEYKWGNDKINTFSGTLENVDKESFWFRVDGCISKIQQDRVTWMLPIPQKFMKNSNEFKVNIGDKFESKDANIYIVQDVLGDRFFRLLCINNGNYYGLSQDYLQCNYWKINK